MCSAILKMPDGFSMILGFPSKISSMLASRLWITYIFSYLPDFYAFSSLFLLWSTLPRLKAFFWWWKLLLNLSIIFFSSGSPTLIDLILLMELCMTISCFWSKSSTIVLNLSSDFERGFILILVKALTKGLTFWCGRYSCIHSSTILGLFLTATIKSLS